MANDSFYIIIRPLGVLPEGRDPKGDSDIHPRHMRSFLRTLCGNETIRWQQSYGLSSDEYWYTKAQNLLLILQIDYDWRNCWQIIVSGSFAWYFENIADIYLVFDILRYKFQDVYAYRPGFGILSTDKAEFSQQIQSYYYDHWQFMERNYGVHKQILPNEFHKHITSFRYIFFEQKKKMMLKKPI